MRKAIVALAGVALSLLPGVAGSQEYPIQTGSLFVSDPTVTPGQAIQISGSGFVPGASVALTLESTQISLGTTAANGAGAIDTTVTIPTSTAPGTHTLKATGAAAGGGTLVLSATITVVGGAGAPGAAGRGFLAFTGGQVLVAGAIATGLLALGAASLMASRRRARRA